MARSMIVNFPPGSNTVLYPTSVAGGAAGEIPLAIPYPVQFPSMLRQLTFTSTDDLSGVDFAIFGQDEFGNIIDEVVVGPNNTTVTSIKYYNIVTSILATAAYTNFSIGYGTTGYSTWLPLNTFATYPANTIQTTTFGTINYSMVQTVDSLQFYHTAGSSYKFTRSSPNFIFTTDPIDTVNASAVVTVNVASTAGLKTGDIVTIANAISAGGITAAHLNITAEITVVNGTSFTYTAGGNGNGSSGGGTNVTYYIPANPTATAIDASLTAATASQLFTSNKPATAYKLLINSSTSPATMKLTLLQQGIE